VRRAPRSHSVVFLALGVTGVAAAGTPLTFEKVLDTALERNERARIAQADEETSAGRLAQARAFFFPSVQLNGNYTRRAFETTRDINGMQVPLNQLNAFSATAQLKWTLFDARGIPLYWAAAATLRASEQQTKESRRLLAFEAADAFLQTIASDALLQAAERRTVVSAQALADAKARQSAGLAGTNDVTLAQLEASTAERARTEAAGSATAARVSLGYLLDLPTGEVNELTAPQALFTTASVQPLDIEAPAVAKAKERRPDVLALKEQAAAAGHAADEPLLRLVPLVSATGQARATNETGLAGRTIDGFVGIDLTWVLFDGGDRYGARTALLAQERSAVLKARLQERKVAIDVEHALLSLRTSRAGFEQARVSEEIATRNATETGLLYRQGLTSALQLADASVRQFEASAVLVKKRYAVVLALLDVRAALGLDPLGREVTP
jgi:outer membrane protein TolC